MDLLRKYPHLFCISLAGFLVFGLRIGRLDLQLLFGSINGRYLQNFTPYFPGLDSIDNHEIFNPKFKNKKKIVLLGASATDSIGCDRSWSLPGERRNAHFSCTIAYQMTQQLHDLHFENWQVFNLARNGSPLSAMVYTYSQLLEIKPDIVIFGDTFPYYMERNAGADDLTGGHYAVMNSLFTQSDEVKRLWAEFFARLRSGGMTKDVPTTMTARAPPLIRVQDKITIDASIDRLLAYLREIQFVYAAPLPIDIQTFVSAQGDDKYQNLDSNLQYASGIALIAEIQSLHGGRTLLYHSPQSAYRNAPNYIQGASTEFGNFAKQHGFEYSNLIDLNLEPSRETYDGVHQTVFGNKRLAETLIQELLAKKLIY